MHFNGWTKYNLVSSKYFNIILKLFSDGISEEKYVTSTFAERKKMRKKMRKK